MPTPLPYLLALKNIPTLFDKITTAKVPDRFTHQFLQTTLGLKSTADRQLIPFLRHLGFIDPSGAPTTSYSLLKSDKRGAAIAAGVRKAYQPLFDADHNAHQLSADKLKSLVAQIAGTDADLTRRIAGTFQAAARVADFESKALEGGNGAKKDPEEEEKNEKEDETPPRPSGLRTEFHYNIQVHLPSNATEETYRNIFNALRKTFE